MTVTFFGHRDTPQWICKPLYNLLASLIEQENADLFYMGNHGSFDRIALSVLRSLKKTYPHIRFYVVLAYLPHQYDFPPDVETLLPTQSVEALPRFAIEKRNNWMLSNSDTIISYVTHTFGGAAKFKERTIAAGKRVFELANPPLQVLRGVGEFLFADAKRKRERDAFFKNVPLPFSINDHLNFLGSSIMPVR